MDINKVTRKIRLDSMHTAVKYQLITELVFLRKQSIIESDLTYLALLVEWGAMPLKQFCNNVVTHLFGAESLRDVEKHPVRVQTVRNRLGLLEKRGLVVKQGKGKKIIAFNPAIEVETVGNILLDYNFLYIETKESKESYTRVSQEVANL
jgi:hypothetical protein